jgi:hypothetical protein
MILAESVALLDYCLEKEPLEDDLPDKDFPDCDLPKVLPEDAFSEWSPPAHACGTRR